MRDFLWPSVCTTFWVRKRDRKAHKVVISDELCWSGHRLSKSRKCCMIGSLQFLCFLHSSLKWCSCQKFSYPEKDKKWGLNTIFVGEFRVVLIFSAQIQNFWYSRKIVLVRIPSLNIQLSIVMIRLTSLISRMCQSHYYVTTQISLWKNRALMVGSTIRKTIQSSD